MNGKKKQKNNCLSLRPRIFLKLFYYLPLQLPCMVQGAWQFSALLQLHGICPFSKLTDTSRIWPCCQIKATSWEMRVAESAREAGWITPCVWRPDLSTLPWGFLSAGAEKHLQEGDSIKPTASCNGLTKLCCPCTTLDSLPSVLLL